jgi:hypothetical protein
VGQLSTPTVVFARFCTTAKLRTALHTFLSAHEARLKVKDVQDPMTRGKRCYANSTPTRFGDVADPVPFLVDGLHSDSTNIVFARVTMMFAKKHRHLINRRIHGLCYDFVDGLTHLPPADILCDGTLTRFDAAQRTESWSVT